jgi:hypothetical protein
LVHPGDASGDLAIKIKCVLVEKRSCISALFSNAIALGLPNDAQAMVSLRAAPPWNPTQIGSVEKRFESRSRSQAFDSHRLPDFSHYQRHRIR